MRLSGRLAVLLDAALRPLHLWPVALPPAGQRRAFFSAGKKTEKNPGQPLDKQKLR